MWVTVGGRVKAGCDWRRREARTRVCLVLVLCLWLSGGGVEEMGWGISKPNRAANYTARLGSGQETGVGASPESHGRGVYGFLGIAVGRDVV